MTLLGASGTRSRALVVSIAILMLVSTAYALLTPVRASDGFFSPPHTDFGVDGDGNNRYEVLQVDVEIGVSSPGNFTLLGTLYNTTGDLFITNETASFSPSSTGPYTASIAFNGTSIFQSFTDGPYNVSLALYNDTGVSVDNDTHITGSYSYLDFGPAFAFVRGGHTDRGTDTDANGRFNFLQVNVSANVSMAGFYMVFGMLASSEVLDMKIRVLNLTAGDHVIPLNFSGIGVYISGDDSPYTVLLLASELRFGDAFDFQDNDTHTADPYFFTDFESGTKRSLTGRVMNETTSQGVVNETLWLTNGTHRWFMQLETNETGFYNFTAFEGDFVLMADAEGLQARSLPLTVAGPTTVDVNLTAPPPDENSVSVTFGDWGNVSLNFEGRGYRDNQSQRFMVDQFVGDGDLDVRQSEVDLWLEVFRQFIPAMNDTTGLFEVDGIPFELVNGTWAFDVDMKGAVTSTEPLLMTQNADYTSQTPIPANATHQVMANLTYDNENETEVDVITFPTVWVLESYQAPANVSVRGLNNNTVVVDPLPRPFGEPESVVVRLNATKDSTPPQITNAWASPDPQEVPEDVTIQAEISENSGIASVKVNVTDPSGGTLGNFTMTEGSPDIYGYTAPFSELGRHNFTVWAKDDAGLMDSVDGNFTVEDTTPPSLGDPGANPTPQEAGQVVDFSVLATDNHQLDEVRIAIEDPSAAPVGNFTMMPGSPYTYSRSFTQLGTYTFTVWATDATGNVASKGGQFVIQDTTPPQITDVTATPDPQEVFGKVNLTATTTENSAIASATVNITDPDGVPLGNFTMASLGGGLYSHEAAYEVLGSYNYTVWVEDAAGLVTSWDGNFTIHDPTAPVLGTPTVGPSPQQVGLTVDFALQVSDNHQVEEVTVAITDPEGALLGEFGMSLVSGNYTYSASYGELGVYSYTISARDVSGNLAAVSGEFTIHDTIPPEVAAIEPLSVEVGQEVTLDAAGSADNHRIVNYTWDFGDGTMGYGPTPTHAYAEPGSYTVKVTVRDAAGNEGRHSFTVTVTAPPPAGPGVSDAVLYGVAGAAVAGVAGAALLLRRRSRRPPSASPKEAPPPAEEVPSPPKEDPDSSRDSDDDLLDSWEV